MPMFATRGGSFVAALAVKALELGQLPAQFQAVRNLRRCLPASAAAFASKLAAPEPE